jgi:hypothetical protein
VVIAELVGDLPAEQALARTMNATLGFLAAAGA